METVSTGRERIALIADHGSFKAGAQEPTSRDPLQWTAFSTYREKIELAKTATGLPCGIMWGECRIEELPVILIVNEFGFMGGSLAIAETETIVRAIDAGIANNLPVIWCASSGGCRIYEGVFSLHCISKFIKARNALAQAHLPLIMVAMHPLVGGANVCSTLADITIGEKGAHMGFAGINVIKSFEKFPLPSGFQTSEYAFAHGHIDEAVEPGAIKTRLGQIVRILSARPKAGGESGDLAPESGSKGADPWSAVQSARNNATKIDAVIRGVFDDFFELHGDRVNADDTAIITGIGRVGGRAFAVVGHNNTLGAAMGLPLSHHFRAVHPAGHRKALRLIRLARRLRMPIATFIDTPGAQSDVRSEAEGQAGIIGELISAMLDAPVPTIGFIVGEGGSAGALPFTTVDRLIMTATATYSVISPEGVAAILARDASKAPEAAAALKLTAHDMLECGVADHILPGDVPQERFIALVRESILYCLRAIAADETPGSHRLRTRI